VTDAADPESPSSRLPPGACDAHAHVISADARTFPLVQDRSYTPEPAPAEAYLAMLRDTGMSRGVLVQVSIYGTDNRYLLQTLKENPGDLRGVVVVNADVSDDTLAQMHHTGVRGVRINVLFGGGIQLDAMEALAAKIAPLGWHLQLLIDARDLPELMPRIICLPVPVVIDHLGHSPARLGTRHPGFRALLDLVSHHNGWVKLSGVYRIDIPPAYSAARQCATKLLEAAPGRVVYGSDWPHVAVSGPAPDTRKLSGLLADWVGDENVLRHVFVSNPESLYDFSGNDVPSA